MSRFTILHLGRRKKVGPNGTDGDVEITRGRYGEFIRYNNLIRPKLQQKAIRRDRLTRFRNGQPGNLNALRMHLANEDDSSNLT